MINKFLRLFIGTVLSWQAHAFNNQFDTIVTFGDSLSDNGNLYKYLFHILPKSPPYFEGHFSNGPLWIEHLYDSYFPKEYQDGFQDYAVGGAGAVLSRKENLPFTLSVEITDYLYLHSRQKKDTSLFAIWIGANNYVNEPTNVDDLTTGVVNAIGEATEKLIAIGGNKFLIANLPDMAKLPQASTSTKPWLLTQLTEAHNQKLKERVDALKDKYPEVLFIYFDAYSSFNEALDHPDYYGFTNLQDSCYQGGYTGLLKTPPPDDALLYKSLKQSAPQLTDEQWSMIKDNPDLREAAEVGYYYQTSPTFKNTKPLSCNGYVFWDKIHPTTALHRLIAANAKQLIDDAGLKAVVPNSLKTQGDNDGRRGQ